MRVTVMMREDLGQVGRLAQQLGYACTEADLHARYLRIQGDPNHILLVAKLEEKVIGWVHSSSHTHSLITPARADVIGLIVDAEHRNQGTGKSLLASVEKWAKSQGLETIRVGTNTTRLDAHRFYRNSGYSLEKSWNLFVKKI